VIFFLQRRRTAPSFICILKDNQNLKQHKKIFPKDFKPFKRHLTEKKKPTGTGKKITVHTNGAEMTFKHFKRHFRKKYRRIPRHEPFLTDFSFKFCRDRKELFNFFLNLCG